MSSYLTLFAVSIITYLLQDELMTGLLDISLGKG